MLVTLRWPGTRPSLEEVCARIGIDPAKADSTFGVICVDKDENLMTVRLSDEVAAGLHPDALIEGVYGDPRIAAFDPDPAPQPEGGGDTSHDPFPQAEGERGAS